MDTATADLLVNASYNGQVLQLKVSPQTTWDVLRQELQQSFQLSALCLSYVDEEGDAVCLDSQEEFQEALKVAQKLGFLQLNISTTPQPPNRGSYVDVLHLKLQKRSPCCRRRSYYSELAHTVGSEHQMKRHCSENSYINTLHATLLRGPSVAVEVEKPTPPAHRRPFKNDYVDSVHMKLATAGLGHSTPQQGKTCVTEHTSAVVEEFRRDLEEVVDMLKTAKDSPCQWGSAPGPVHCDVICDGCDNIITGSRYKCGNCPDYDLCEHCEKKSDTIHPADHVFLKLKTPTPRAGLNKKGKMKPLLRKNLYMPHPDFSSSEDESPEKFRVRRERRVPPYQQPLHRASNEAYITKSREKLREELIAAKLRRKEEKRRLKLEAHEERKRQKAEAPVAMIEAKLAAMTVDSPGAFTGDGGKIEPTPPPVFKPPQRKGHEKTFAAKVMLDTCYQTGSVVAAGMTFEKGWVIKNTGTKKWKHVCLVHQEGFKPCTPEIVVPEIKPGETVEVRVRYPALEAQDPDYIKSSWKLIHKGTTPFGPTLWLAVQVDKKPLSFSASPFPPPLDPPTTITLPTEPVTNDDLLKSIGFIPSDSARTSSIPPFTTLPPPEATLQGEGGGMEEESSLVIVPLEKPDSLNISTERLVDTFEMVETPKSVMSLTSNDSLYQPPPEQLGEDGEMDAASVISHASNNSEDFVIVIPDCFDLDKPLAGFTAPDMSHDNHMTPLANQDQEPEQQETISKEPPTPTPQTAIPGALPPPPELPSHVQTSPPKASASPLDPPKGNFGRVTFQTVKDGRFCNPLTIATGFVNSMSDFVEEHIHFTPSSKSTPGTNTKREPHTQESDNEEVFEDAPEVPAPSKDHSEATPSAPPPSLYPDLQSQPWVRQEPDVSQWVRQDSDGSRWVSGDQDVRQWVSRDQDPSKWVHNPDVSHWVSREWEGPPAPQTPMERLVAMGFADRELNARLLSQHQNQLQSVINELLDKQDWASTRHGD